MYSTNIYQVLLKPGTFPDSENTTVNETVSALMEVKF